MKRIINYLNSNTTFEKLVDNKKEIHCGNDESFAFYVYYKFVNFPKTTVVVMENLLACQNIYNKLSNMLPDKVYMYCVDEITKYTSLATSPEMISSRIFVLNKLLEQDEVIIITHTMAVKRLTPSVKIYKEKTINIELDEESIVVYGKPQDLFKIKEAITSKLPEVEFDLDEITYIAKEKVELSGEDLELFNRVLTMLDEVEDVQHVYHNVEL